MMALEGRSKNLKGRGGFSEAAFLGKKKAGVGLEGRSKNLKGRGGFSEAAINLNLKYYSSKVFYFYELSKLSYVD